MIALSKPKGEQNADAGADTNPNPNSLQRKSDRCADSRADKKAKENSPLGFTARRRALSCHGLSIVTEGCVCVLLKYDSTSTFNGAVSPHLCAS